MESLLVIDGNSILNRAYYGVRTLTTKDGLPTNAVFGFLNILKKHIDALAPTRIICAFDRKGPTFRHRMYDGYKATRRKMPEELAIQLPYARRAAEALGCRVIAVEGYEADDVLGTAAAQAEAEGTRVFLLTGDRDSLQLLSPLTSVILIKNKEDVLYTPDSFEAEYGVTPSQYVDVKALMGDASDNIPGVPGIGEKTAFPLIARAGSLDGVYADVDALGLSRSAHDKLLAGRDSAYLSKKLATICREAPLGEEEIPAHYDPARLDELFRELEFTQLRARFHLDETPAAAAPAPEIPVFTPYDPAEALPEGEPLCIAMTADGSGALVCGEVCRTFGGADEIAAALAAHPVVCHDYKSLLRRLGAKAQPACAFDTMLAAYLLSPGEGTYPLSRTVFSFLGLEDYPDGAEAAAYLIARLAPIQRQKLEEDGMLRLLFEIEIPLAAVLADMEEAGFRLDAEGLHAYISELEEAAEELRLRVYDAAGIEFNLNSPKQLGEVLFERLGLPASKKTHTGYATDADTLSRLRPYHPIIADILDYRQLVKLIGTYGDNLIAMAGPDGRIRSTFNQTGTATGRLSSADPNMQNIPVRGELGREMRKYFVASDDEHVLLDADYSQIELRLLAALSGDENMQRVFREGGDIHRSTAAEVFRVAPEAVTPELRLRAKAVNFGIVYGIGEYSLSQDLNITRRQAGAYIRSYFDAYPKIEAFLRQCVENARRDGYTTTYFGRRRRIPELASSNHNLRAFGERAAMNSPIQGTAADVIKIAMIRTHRALREAGLDARLILQVHDELILEVSRKDAEAAARLLREAMEGAVSLDVPLTVEVSSGASWFEAKH